MKINPSIDEILAFALDFDDLLERDRFVLNACAKDESLLAEVRRMLSLVPQLGSFIETPLEISTLLGTNTILVPSADLTGQVIGPYQILSLKARGGMGRVYLAQQEAPIRRRVAIKVIRNELANDEILARFELERNVLSLMDHPNIARVLDAGTTSSGEPFVAMEWVDGDSITEYCSREGLPVRERIELLFTICKAVQHAHQKGIIHRDLKPSNILVTVCDGKSIPKIIDFGIARATADSTLGSDQMTGAGQIMGTLDYMAPEQADPGNLDIDIRADVYSLGAVAYELLTHSPPLACKTSPQISLSERLRIVRECAPEKPSKRIADSTIRMRDHDTSISKAHIHMERIDADLDWIVLKCLEKERGRRFETVVALAQDLERYLKGQPVLACPPTLRYRFRKFAQRYSAVLALGTSLGMMLLVTTIVSIVQAVRVNRLHQQSQANLVDAQGNLKLAIDAVEKFCTEVSNDLRMTKQDLRPLRKKLLSTAVEFHQQLLQRRGKSELARLDLAQAYRQLAELSKEIDTPVQARHFYELAISEFEGLSAEQQAEPNIQYDLGRCWQRLSHLRLQNASSEESLFASQRCASIYEKILTSNPDSIQSQVALAETRLQQSAIAYAINNIDLADDRIRQAIEGWKDVVKNQPEVPEWLAQLAYSHLQLGKNLLSRSLSRWRDAEPELKTACEFARRAVSHPNAGDFCHQVLADSLLELGKIAKVRGRTDESLKHLSEAAAKLEVIHQGEPSVWFHAITLARCYSQLSSLYLLQESNHEAKDYLVRGQRILTPLIQEGAGNSIAEVVLSTILQDLGNLTFKEGDAEAGLELLNESVRLIESVLERDSELRVRTEQAPFAWLIRGRALVQLKRYDAALRDYDLAIKNANQGFREQVRLDRSGILIQIANYRPAMLELKETMLEIQGASQAHYLANQYVRCAKLFVECGARAMQDADIDELEQLAIRDECFIEAIGLLRKAQNSGLNNFDSLRSIVEFEALHGRTDFEQLFAHD